MDDLSLLKLRLNEFIRLCSEAKNLADGFEKAAREADRQRLASEAAVLSARDEYRKLTLQASEYRSEFERKKKSEYDAIEKDKKEAKKAHELAAEKLDEANRLLESAKQKEASADGRLAEIAKKEVDLARKQEQVRSFITSFK